MIVEQILKKKASDIRQYPVHTNRASSLGHPCIRYLVLDRLRWTEKKIHSPELQLIFDLGNDIEKRVMFDIQDAGLQIIEQQRTFEWREYNITGHIDAKVLINDKVYPLEIKSMSPFVFDKINSVDDMLKNKYHYIRAYPAQMTLYLLMDNKEEGIFLFKNKTSGKMKEIIINLDYELGESLIRKAETINEYCAMNTLPDPIEWDDMVCGECGHLTTCNPLRLQKSLEIIDDDELLELLERRNELKEMAKEYEDIDDILKAKLEGKDKLLIGSYFITGSWRIRPQYNVPKDIKEQYKEEIKYWTKKIIKV